MFTATEKWNDIRESSRVNFTANEDFYHVTKLSFYSDFIFSTKTLI